MTTKEKAKELFNKFCYAIRTEQTDSGYFTNVLYAKQCALIAVDEAVEYEKRIIKEVQFLSDIAGHAFRCEGLYWEQVKQEIEKL